MPRLLTFLRRSNAEKESHEGSVSYSQISSGSSQHSNVEGGKRRFGRRLKLWRRNTSRTLLLESSETQGDSETVIGMTASRQDDLVSDQYGDCSTVNSSTASEAGSSSGKPHPRERTQRARRIQVVPNAKKTKARMDQKIVTETRKGRKLLSRQGTRKRSSSRPRARSAATGGKANSFVDTSRSKHILKTVKGDNADGLNLNVNRVHLQQELRSLLGSVKRKVSPFDINDIGDAMESIAIKYTEIGCIHLKKNALDLSVEYFEKALLLYKSIAGEGHPRTADMYDLVACVYSEEGDFDCALQFHMDALRAREKVQYDSSAEIAKSHFFIGWVYCRQGNYDDALNHHAKSLTMLLACQERDHNAVASSFIAVGYVYKVKGQFARALSHVQTAIDIRVKQLGRHHPDTASALSQLAAIQHDRGFTVDSLKNYRESLKIRMAALGSADPLIAIVRMNIATGLSEIGKTSKAIKQYELALPVMDKIRDGENIDSAAACNNLGRLYSKLGHDDMALSFLERALSAKLALYKRGEVQLKDVLLTNAEIGLALCDQGRHAEASDRLQQLEKEFPVKRPSTSTSLRDCPQNSALFTENPFPVEMALSMLERKETAESQEFSCLFSAQLPLAVNDTSINSKKQDGLPQPISGAISLLAEGLSDIGRFHFSQRDFDGALQNYTKALCLYETARGVEHPETTGALDFVAGTYTEIGEYDRALEFHSMALKIRIALHGESHPTTATSYSLIGWVLDSMERFEDALEFHKQALDIRSKCFGLGHEATASSFDNVGGMLHALGDHDSAYEHHLMALRIRQMIMGPTHPETALSYSRIGIVQSSRGFIGEALLNHRHALELRQAALGEGSLDTTPSSHNIVSAERVAQMTVHARKSCEDLLETCRRAYGSRHARTATAESNLGILHHQLGNHDKALSFLRRSIRTRKFIHKKNGKLAGVIEATKNNIDSVLADQKKLSRPVLP